MARNISFRDFDWLLLFLVLLICAVGVVQIYSATLNTKFVDFHIRQIYWVVGGVALMFGVSRINYQALLKLVLILAMAKYFADTRSEEGELRDIIKAGLLIFVPMLLVLAEPDMGTALTYTSIAIMGLFLGGLKFKHAAVVILIAALCAPIAYKYGLKEYQRNRLLTFVDPEADPDHKGYQVIQSKIAVGSGGITGKGVAKGTQTQGSFLPIAQTDFIAAAYAEEHGLVGALVLLLLYFMVLMHLVHNAQTAPDRGGTFIVMGVVAVLTFHVLINVGMVVGFMPVTGIPLPLMSYGGSSVLFTFLALGIVMNIRMRRFVN